VGQSRAVRGDSRRPHQPVEVRIRPRELDVVVPAGANVVADVVVDHGSDCALAFEEARPAEVDDSADQALLVAEVVVERRRGHSGGVADLPRGNVTVHGFREERGRGFDDSDLDGFRLGSSRSGGHGGIIAGLTSVTKVDRVAVLYWLGNRGWPMIVITTLTGNI